MASSSPGRERSAWQRRRPGFASTAPAPLRRHRSQRPAIPTAILLTGRKTPEEPAEQILRLPETASSIRPLPSTPPPTPATAIATSHSASSRSPSPAAASRSRASPARPRRPHTATSSRRPCPPGWFRPRTPPPKPSTSTGPPTSIPASPVTIVYRRAAGTNRAAAAHLARRQAGDRLGLDRHHRLPGQRYAYSVSAIDVSGNESARSAEVEDQWNAPVAQPSSTATPHP